MPFASARYVGGTQAPKVGKRFVKERPLKLMRER